MTSDPIEITIGNSTTPLTVQPNIRIDHIYNTVYDSTAFSPDPDDRRDQRRDDPDRPADHADDRPGRQRRDQELRRRLDQPGAEPGDALPDPNNNFLSIPTQFIPTVERGARVPVPDRRDDRPDGGPDDGDQPHQVLGLGDQRHLLEGDPAVPEQPDRARLGRLRPVRRPDRRGRDRLARQHQAAQVRQGAGQPDRRSSTEPDLLRHADLGLRLCRARAGRRPGRHRRDDRQAHRRARTASSCRPRRTRPRSRRASTETDDLRQPGRARP